MKFDNVPRHKRFDEKGYFILDESYFMSYSHHDGFTERLLSIDLLIDKNFELNLFHQCFKLGSHYAKSDDDFHFKKTVNEIPYEIFSFLENIMTPDAIDLKDNYDFEGFQMDDIPSQLYLFNSSAKTKAISINGLLPLTGEFFTTDIEKKFLKFHIFIKEWTNKIYETYISDYSP